MACLKYFMFRLYYLILTIWEITMRKLLLIENQMYIEMDQTRRDLQVNSHESRVQCAEATRRIRDYIGILREGGDVLMFLRRTRHTVDSYNRAQVGSQPLDQ